MMTTFQKLLAGGALAAGVLSFSAFNASAAIVYNGDVCWHAQETYHYPSSDHIVVHRDDWHAGPHVTFREHEGPGYWRGGSWITIRP